MQPTSSEYSPLARWSWNYGVAEHRRLHLRALKNAGFGAIVVRLPAPLSSDELRDFFVECHNIELEIWFTNESVPPSWSLWYQTHEVSAHDILNSVAQSNTDSVVLAVPLDGDAPQFTQSIYVPSDTDSVREPLRLLAEQYDQFRICHWQVTHRAGVDVTSFLASTQQAIAALQSVEENSRATVRGILWNAQREFQGFPFHPEFFDKFEQLHHSALPSQLLSLVANTGNEAARVRHQFWETWAGLCEKETSALRDFADRNKLAFHFTVAGTLSDTALHFGDLANAVRSGVTAPQIQTESELATRAACSLNQLNKQNCDVAGLPSSSDAIFSVRTSFINEAFLAGVSRVLQSDVNRPSQVVQFSQTQQPFFSRADVFNQYLARVGQQNGASKTAARIGVLWPGRSVWTHFNPRGHRFVRWVEEDLQRIAYLLDELHYEFIFVNESTLVSSPTKLQESSTHIICGAARVPLEMLIVPSVTALSRDCWNKLREFAQNGGRVAFLGLLPRWSELGRDEELEAEINRETRVEAVEIYDAYGAHEKDAPHEYSTYPLSREYHSGGRLCCYQPRLEADADAARLYVSRILRESLTPDFETQTESLRYAHRINENGELFLVWNSADENVRANIRLRPQCNGAPHLLNYQNGEWRKCAQWTVFPSDEGGGLNLTLDFAPGELQIVWLDALSSADETPHVQRATFEIETFDGETATGYAMQNGTPLFATHEEGKIQWHRVAEREIKVPPPILLSNWQAERRGPQVWPLVAHRQGLHEGAGFRATFEVEEAPAELWLCVPAALAVDEISLDGRRIGPCASPFNDNLLWNNSGWQWFALNCIDSGHNSLFFAADNQSDNLRVLLIGDFSLRENDEWLWGEEEQNSEPQITTPQPVYLSGDSWHEAGLPFYAGEVEYSISIQILDEWQNCRLFLEIARTPDVVECVANSASCGVRFAPPYRFELTPQLRVGEENQIALRVWNSAQAIEVALQDEPQSLQPSGVLSSVRLVAYPRVEWRKS